MASPPAVINMSSTGGSNNVAAAPSAAASGASGLVVGLELVPDAVLVAGDLEAAFSARGFSFGVQPLLRRSIAEQRLSGSSASTAPDTPAPGDAFLAEEVLISEPLSSIVGEVADWLDLDSSDDAIRQRSETLLRMQVQWAGYVGLSHLMFPCPSEGPIVNFARWVNYCTGLLSYTQVLVRTQLGGPRPPQESWQRWNTIRLLTESNANISLAVDLLHDLPPDSVIDQWMAEPIKLVIIPTTVFIANRKGFPVLSKRHQQVVRRLFDLQVQFVISSNSLNIMEAYGGLSAFRQYLEHLYDTRPEPNEVDKFAVGYHDYLQMPLQPLMDNLESATYEVFEKDPVKYREYERAIAAALTERTIDTTTPTVVMVVGAGRGPLVDCALRAAKSSNRRIILYAVEKNPNAILILREKNATRWGDSVQIFHSDMRLFKPPVKADILVSELLGSFGDNELSPECLDGAQKFLKSGGISIPSSSTAYIAPISSSKLHGDVSSHKDIAHMETPYVVRFRAVNVLADPIPVWNFHHPNPEATESFGHNFNAHNTRYAATTFKIANETTLHGFAGYFETVLYKDIMLSIHPATHSPGMFSWFPLYFPIKVPMTLPKNSSIDVHFWRLTDARKVWYEWACLPKDPNGQCVATGGSGLHNVKGRSSWIGL
ncbi:PRMT5 arginine-N-methyltransferase-domain-containing protein [Zopfochytrium polystomum]|nr:PRMT5 arginine-N-methyltransferase-domain-containing protein [Zopfochytrium polystomum]